MSRAIEKVENCNTMADVRRNVNRLDDILVPLLVERGGYMTHAAKVKNDPDLVRDEDRIEAIVARVREQAALEGGQPDVIEAIYRSMMEAYIAYEHRELARLQAASTPKE